MRIYLGELRTRASLADEVAQIVDMMAVLGGAVSAAHAKSILRVTMYFHWHCKLVTMELECKDDSAQLSGLAGTATEVGGVLSGGLCLIVHYHQTNASLALCPGIGRSA